MCVCVHVCVHEHVHVFTPLDDDFHAWFSPIMWVSGIELRSSELPDSAFTH